ncbi:MAG TPA: OmpA family protein [bacterium]|nr:OmpA family protein [bacterium]
MKQKKALRLVPLAFAAILVTALSAEAKPKGASVITFSPATDGGKYISVQQSKTLPQWSFNAGMTMDYAYEPLEFADPTGARISGIVDDLMVANVHGAIGWTDWFSTGVNVPVVMWESFWDPNAPRATVQKQNFYGKMGDVRLEMKFRLLDIDRYHVGLSLVPFMYFPSGKSSTFLGNGFWSPGAALVFDADIKNRVFLALNVAYRNFYSKTNYYINPNANANAYINDTLRLAGGINVRINDSWAVLGEIWSESVIKAMFKNQLQNPAEFMAGGRFTPQKHAKGLAVTLAGGRGITTGVGSPDFRVLLGVNYRRIHEPPPPPPVQVDAIVEEKIIITQKIHFEFDRAVIRPVSYPIVDDVADLLRRNPQIRRVRVEGHTDWIGSDAYNQKLSENRARAVRDYLIQKGVEPSRLEAVGYGESRPVADNNTVQGRARNRRTEFTVLQ